MRTLPKQSYFFAIVGAIFILSANPLSAQQVNAGIEDGFPHYGSFHGSNFDHVLLQGRSLHVDIPLLSVKQRGGKTFSYHYIYDTPNYQLVFIPNPNPTPTNPGYYTVQSVPNDDTGWRLTNPFRYSSMHTTTNEACTPQVAYNHTDNYILTDPDGTKHQFALRTEYPTTCNGQQLSGPALDGSGIFWNLQTNTITLKDGTQLPLGGLRDPNGNNATSSADTLNRNLVSVQGSTWTIQDSNGNPQTFQLQSATFNIHTHVRRCSANSHMPRID